MMLLMLSFLDRLFLNLLLYGTVVFVFNASLRVSFRAGLFVGARSYWLWKAILFIRIPKTKTSGGGRGNRNHSSSRPFWSEPTKKSPRMKISPAPAAQSSSNREDDREAKQDEVRTIGIKGHIYILSCSIWHPINLRADYH
jgi:hypothetical protein